MIFNGHAFCQLDQNGIPSVEPPLYTWLAAACSKPLHQASLLGLQLPGSLAFLGCTLMLWFVGRWHFGVWAGFFAALLLMASPGGVQCILLGCGDSLYMLLAAGAAVAAFRAWSGGGFGGWLLFGFLSALATMAQGLLGLLPVAALGVGMLMTRRRKADSTERDRALRVSVAGVATAPRLWRWLPGLLLFVALCGTWLFCTAKQSGGMPTSRVLTEGLLGWAPPAAPENVPNGMAFRWPVGALLPGFAPWCLLTLAGLWSVFRRTTKDENWGVEHFLAWYLVFGVFLFLLVPHARANLAVPLVLPAAWLAGREAARLTARWRLKPRRILAGVAVAWGLLLAGTSLHFHLFNSGAAAVVQTRAVQKMAAEYHEKIGREDRALLYTEDAPPVFQFFRGTMQRSMPASKVAAMLAGIAPATAVVGDVEAMRAAVAAAGGTCREVVPGLEARVTGVKNDRPPKNIARMGILTNLPAENRIPSGSMAYNTDIHDSAMKY